MSIISRSSRIFAISIALLILSSGAAAAVTITNGYHTPEPAPGEHVSNQILGFKAVNVSGDGNTDKFYIRFDNRIAPNISLNQESVEGASISSSVEYISGKDDPTVDTARFAVSPDTGKLTDLNVTLDFSVSYPNKTASYPVHATIDGSKPEKHSIQVANIKTKREKPSKKQQVGDQQDKEQIPRNKEEGKKPSRKTRKKHFQKRH